MSNQFALPSYFTKLGPDGVKALRQMPLAAGEEWLRIKYPELTPEETSLALATCAPAATDARFETRIAPKVHDRLFIIAAWLAGASLNQLARMRGTSRQSVVERLERALPKAERNACRLVEPPISDARLYEMKSAFDSIVGENDKVFDGVHPVRIAAMLMAVPSEGGE